MIRLNVVLDEIKSDEMIPAFIMIKKCFFKTFLTYFDNISPVLESYKKFKRKFFNNKVALFWIISESKKAGIVEVKSHRNCLHISNLAVLHGFQNRGIGKAAVRELFNKYNDADTFHLYTIKQDKRNCRFYESLGFSQTGFEHKINRRMTLIEYKRIHYQR